MQYYTLRTEDNQPLYNIVISPRLYLLNGVHVSTHAVSQITNCKLQSYVSYHNLTLIKTWDERTVLV